MDAASGKDGQVVSTLRWLTFGSQSLCRLSIRLEKLNNRMNALVSPAFGLTARDKSSRHIRPLIGIAVIRVCSVL